jgi:hypothetical protein
MDEPKQPLIPFTPAQLRPRHDGWTAEKQVHFIETLAATKCIDEACRRVGMSDTSAYELRNRPCGAAFARAWDIALEYKLDRVEDGAIERSINGVARPIFYKGQQVGEWRYHDERLTMFLLRSRRPDRFGKWVEHLPAPDLGEYVADPAIRLDGPLTELEFDGPGEEGNPAADDDEDMEPPSNP